LTVAVFLIVLAKSHFSHSAPAAAVEPIVAANAPSVPKADFDAWYKPKPTPAPELVEPATKK
jgi:hypothetical protein